MILAEITKLVSRGPTGVEGEGEDWGKDRSLQQRTKHGAATESTDSPTPPPPASRHEGEAGHTAPGQLLWFPLPPHG